MAEEKKKASLYHKLVAHDIIAWMQPVLTRAGWNCRFGDGKLTVQRSVAHETPWVHVKHAMDLDCETWHHIMFDVVFKQLGKKWIPSKCQQCWKVVVRPTTLVGLHALEAIQRRMDVPSKCGIEIRDSVHGLYGGYFYTHSLEEGLNRYKQVRAEVDADSMLGPDIKVILKRACTEYEMLCGPSNEWTVSPEQMQVEEEINNYVVRDLMAQQQPRHIQDHVRRKWIEFAYSCADPTYVAFTGGEPIYPHYVTYHQLLDGKPEEVQAACDNFRTNKFAA